jgi:hypothetical protein
LVELKKELDSFPITADFYMYNGKIESLEHIDEPNFTNIPLKYLKSKKTGIIYDYEIYTSNGDQVVIGKWNESKNQIDFKAEEEEESEDEYESDDE